MQISDARLIIDLADSVRTAAPVQKDAEAAQLISQLIGSQPDALYFLVQTVLLQKEALAAQAAAGDSRHVSPPPGAESTAFALPEEQRGRWGGLFGSRRQQTPTGGESGGGSFLRTAAAGAAGVAGGVLLAQGISSLVSPPPVADDHEMSSYDDDPNWDDDGESF